MQCNGPIKSLHGNRAQNQIMHMTIKMMPAIKCWANILKICLRKSVHGSEIAGSFIVNVLNAKVHNFCLLYNLVNKSIMRWIEMLNRIQHGSLVNGHTFVWAFIFFSHCYFGFSFQHFWFGHYRFGVGFISFEFWWKMRKRAHTHGTHTLEKAKASKESLLSCCCEEVDVKRHYNRLTQNSH